jgi:hypothetical protein
MYGKFFASTFTGSMFGAGAVVFAVWGYVIANTTADSTVELNPRMLAATLGSTAADVESAIAYLCAPDPKSRNPEMEGRRLCREGQFQFRVVTHQHYRAIRNNEDRKEYNRQKQQESRARRKSPSTPVKTNVIDGQHLSAQVEVEEEVEVEEKGERPPSPQAKPKPTEEPDDFNQDPETNIPEGMALLQYACFVLQQASIPAGYALKIKTGDTIELLAKDEGCTLAVATKRLLDRMRNAGPQKWNFWLQDGGWKQAGMDATERAFLYGVPDD